MIKSAKDSLTSLRTTSKRIIHQPLTIFKLNFPAIKKMERVYHPLHRITTQDPSLHEDDKHILTSDQQEILDIATSPERPSLFFTGQAGTGKTFLLRRIITELSRIERQEYNRDPQKTLAITSTTGISASHINGTTLHSWSGIGLMGNNVLLPKMVLSYIRNIPRNKHVRKRWMDVQTLIIDECSMLTPDTLDLLDYIGREMKKLDEPFGGIQVILCGDFMQLPPVVTPEDIKKKQEFIRGQRENMKIRLLEKKKEEAWLKEDGKVELTAEDWRMIKHTFPLVDDSRRYCFEAKSWKYIIDGDASVSRMSPKGKVIMPKKKKMARELQTPFRQQTDCVFFQVLNLLRSRTFSPNHEKFPVVDAILSHLSMSFEQRPFDRIFRMLATGCVKSLDDLKDEVEYSHVYDGYRFKLSKEQVYEDSAFSKLSRIADPTCSPVLLFPRRKDADELNFKTLLSLNQNINSSDDDDDDDDDMFVVYDALDFKPNFEESSSLLPTRLILKRGAQVMLTKNIRSSIGLVNGQIGIVERFVKFPVDRLTKNARIPKQLEDFISINYNNNNNNNSNEEYLIFPVVRFPLIMINFDWSELEEGCLCDIDREKKTIAIPIVPKLECETITRTRKEKEGNRNKFEMEMSPTRLQIPLRLAWSYSIHKSQGQTLPKIELDLSSIFEHGQMYVGLSRAASLASIRLLGYHGRDDRIWKLLKHDRVVEFYEQLKNNHA